METLIRQPDRPSARDIGMRALPPRPDSPRPAGLTAAAVRGHRLAQTRVWGFAAAGNREDDREMYAPPPGRLPRPASVFGQMRGSQTGSRAHRSEWRGGGNTSFFNGSSRSTMNFRRAQSFHRYARIGGTVRPVAKKDLDAIDEGLGVVHVVETPVIRVPCPVVIGRDMSLQRASSGSLHDTPIEA